MKHFVSDLSKADKPIKEHWLFHGLEIEIENPVGSWRHWKVGNEEGKTQMRLPYGYIKGTLGTDGDDVDCFVGPNPSSKKVFIITQMKAPSFKETDENKIMLGFDDAEQAKKAYLSHYTDPKFFGSMKEMKIKKFKRKLFKKKNEGKLIKSPALSLHDLALAKSSLMPPGAGWEAIPHGKHGGFRRMKGSEWEYWYPKHGGTHPQAMEHHEPPAQSWKTATKFTEEDFTSGRYDKQPDHWHWRQTDGDLKPWKSGGIDPSSRHPVKVGGVFARLYQIDEAEDPGNPGYAILRDVNSGQPTLMQHTRIYPVDHDPLRRKTVKEKPTATSDVTWIPSGGKKPTNTRGVASAAGRRAPAFSGSMADATSQPGLHAIESGLYPMKNVERWEVDDDGKKRKVTKDIIGVTDLGKTQLVKEFEGLIANTARATLRQYGLKPQFERSPYSEHSVNITLRELQRAGVEGLLAAIEDYDAENAFTPKAQQFVRDYVRLAAARERLGGITLPARHQRNVGRFIAARAEASHVLGIEDPTPEQVAPFFKLLKRHLHGRLSADVGREPVPMEGYTLPNDTRPHYGKLEWLHLYHSFLAGTGDVKDIFDEDRFALPGLEMGLGYSPEEKASMRQTISKVLEGLRTFEHTTEGRKKTTYQADIGKILSMRLGLAGEEASIAEIAAAVPVYVMKDGKKHKLAADHARSVINDMIDKAIVHVSEATKGETQSLVERAHERLVPPVIVPHGPTWTEVVQRRAKTITLKQVEQYRTEERTRLHGLIDRSRERAESSRADVDRMLHEGSQKAAQEALRRVDRMSPDEIKQRLAQRASPETAEMRRLMTRTFTVEQPMARGMTRGTMLLRMTDIATGEEKSVRVSSLRDQRDPEERGEMEMLKSSRDLLRSGMLHEVMRYPRSMRLLVASDQLGAAPTMARVVFEKLMGLGG